MLTNDRLDLSRSHAVHDPGRRDRWNPEDACPEFRQDLAPSRLDNTDRQELAAHHGVLHLLRVRLFLRESGPFLGEVQITLASATRRLFPQMPDVLFPHHVEVVRTPSLLRHNAGVDELLKAALAHE